ncbi:hypothetical protein K457DRAFT_783456 [Linnemannia elongata AG-77]|uniref:Uncharacterized protein n=1 Tax=Linnemannia elongata AG-77 TaxID=1314771 RepID=A0A197JK42_9FUNG|nr:hypothetical protein K457DRAFT_783456 [Linnemannia elongata AG-77]
MSARWRRVHFVSPSVGLGFRPLSFFTSSGHSFSSSVTTSSSVFIHPSPLPFHDCIFSFSLLFSLRKGYPKKYIPGMQAENEGEGKKQGMNTTNVHAVLPTFFVSLCEFDLYALINTGILV